MVFINNAVYGMTGGQMAPTTMIDQVTATTPKGRTGADQGYPLQVSELLATLPGTTYIERCSLHDPAHIRKSKKALKHAFELQVVDGGSGGDRHVVDQAEAHGLVDQRVVSRRTDRAEGVFHLALDNRVY